MALSVFLSACNDEKKVENGAKISLKGTPEQEAFSKKFFKGVDEFKGLSKEKAMPERR